MAPQPIVRALIRWAEERGLVADVSSSGNVAIFSKCRRYRLALTRIIGISSRLLVCVGLNPSTANAFRDDPTIRRGIGFARLWECGLYLMLNTHSFRATDPKTMAVARAAGEDVVGEYNDLLIRFVLDQLASQDVPLAAWSAKCPTDRADAVSRIARDVGVQWQCLGTNQDGSPKHPLYLPRGVIRRPWPAELS